MKLKNVIASRPVRVSGRAQCDKCESEQGLLTHSVQLRIAALAKGALALPVYLYRYAFSPFFPANCRFQPTCSAYALEALQLHGPLKGTWLTVRRIGQCHPWGGQGHDPVPEYQQRKRHERSR